MGEEGALAAVSKPRLPSRAQVVVIGGGVVGCSVAYHLTKLGVTDVVLLEQGTLSCGTTWHAAGLVGPLRASESGTRLVQYSADLYDALEAETGFATGYRNVGGVVVARTPDRLAQLRRTAANAVAYDLDCELLTPAGAQDLWPLMAVDDLLGAIWLPGDGRVNPADLTQSLARGAQQGGATILERVRVTGFEIEDGPSGRRVTGARTDAGDLECEVVVNCAGQWAKAIGDLAGVTVPLHSAEHFYVVTEPVAGVHPDLPIMRDPDGWTYFKEETGGLVVGAFEPDAKPWRSPSDLPHPFEFQLLEEDWEHFAPVMEEAIVRIPALAETGVRKLYNGPESFTPDNQFLLGQAPGLRGFFVGAGFNSVGIASAGGAGRALAEWVVEGEPTSDLVAVDVRRFAPFHGDEAWLRVSGGRGAGRPLRHPVAAAGARERPAAAAFAPARAPRHAGRRVRLADGVGAAAGLRLARLRRLLLGETRLVRPVGRRAGGDPAAGRGLRPDLVLPLRRAGCRCTRRPGVDLRRRRRRTGRWLRLHAVPQRPRHLRGRPDGHPDRIRLLPAGLQLRDHDPRPRLDRAPRARRRRRDAHRPDRRVVGARGDGPTLARAARPGVRHRLDGPGVPLRHQPGGRGRRPDAASDPDHLRRRAGLGARRAGRGRASPSTTPCATTAMRPTSGWATPATTRSSRSGSRRATAPSRAT